MSSTIPHRIALALVALFAAASAHASLFEVREHEETIDMEGIAKIDLYVSAGSIEINGADRANTHLHVKKDLKTTDKETADAKEAEIEERIERVGDTLYVVFKYKNERKGFWESLFGDNKNVSFKTTLSVPKNVELKVGTAGGHIRIEDIDGKIEARTSGGHMNFHNIGADLMAKTSGGHIVAKRVDGDIDLSTSGGHLEISGVSGISRLRTSGGHIKADVSGGEINAHTSGGNVTAVFNEGINANSVLKTSGGSITATLPPDQSFQLEASTSGGSVNYDYRGQADGSFKPKSISATINGGGPLLKLHTSGGSVKIRSS